MSDLNRRGFIKSAMAASVAGTLGPFDAAAQSLSEARPPRPIAISSANGTRAIDRAMEMMRQGEDTLDAVVAGVNIVEDDPNDRSVGYGGLPNEDGVVELDSCVMHGPSNGAGAVASIRNIKNPSSVAKVVMERTDHVLLVGEGALRFARAHGFEEVNLLTDESRERWLRWKENLSDRDDWIPPSEGSGNALMYDSERVYGTINATQSTSGVKSPASRPRAGCRSRYPVVSAIPPSSAQVCTSMERSEHADRRAGAKRT